jgi:hypothetical protein
LLGTKGAPPRFQQLQEAQGLAQFQSFIGETAAVAAAAAAAAV